MSTKAIRKILECHAVPENIKTKTIYGRHDDGDQKYKLKVLVDSNGTCFINTGYNHDKWLEFRTFAEKGKSIRVRKALLILAEAIRLDNELGPA